MIGNLVFRLKWKWLKEIFWTRSQIKLPPEVRKKLAKLLEDDIQLWARVNSNGNESGLADFSGESKSLG